MQNNIVLASFSFSSKHPLSTCQSRSWSQSSSEYRVMVGVDTGGGVVVVMVEVERQDSRSGLSWVQRLQVKGVAGVPSLHTAPLSGRCSKLPRAGVILPQIIPKGMWGPENVKFKIT